MTARITCLRSASVVPGAARKPGRSAAAAAIAAFCCVVSAGGALWQNRCQSSVSCCRTARVASQSFPAPGPPGGFRFGQPVTVPGPVDVYLGAFQAQPPDFLDAGPVGEDLLGGPQADLGGGREQRRKDLTGDEHVQTAPGQVLTGRPAAPDRSGPLRACRRGGRWRRAGPGSPGTARR
ncbi:MAG: hypothetical protein ACRDPF_16275, partial [Streptosporangiaceae bacterium]